MSTISCIPQLRGGRHGNSGAQPGTPLRICFRQSSTLQAWIKWPPRNPERFTLR